MVVKYPNISEHLQNHFMRGVFDVMVVYLLEQIKEIIVKEDKLIYAQVVIIL